MAITVEELSRQAQQLSPEERRKLGAIAITRTYLDSGVLIAAACGNDEAALLAFALLAETSRVRAP